MRSARGVVAMIAVIVASGGATPALADAPFDSAIDVQTFEYAIGPKTFFTVNDADVTAAKQLAFDALLTFLTNPFKIYNYDPVTKMPTTERVDVVRSMTSMQLTAAYGITDKLQLGVNLPFIFQLSGDGLMPNTGMAAPGGLRVTGLGDLVVEGKMRLYVKQALRLGGIVGVSLPSSFGSNGSQFIGDNTPTLRGRVAAQWDAGPLSLGANAGVIFRDPRTIYGTTIGQQLTWGVGAAYHVTERLSVIAEGYGRVGMFDLSRDEAPLELIGGLRLYATSAIAVVAGGGAGLTGGLGSPDSRFFLSVGYAPDVRDTDGDGIPNSRDKCPLEPEDFDGFEDADGCPDPDNDHDGIPDKEDKCPNEPEDHDGFQDEDGCPEPDNDGDGIPDLQDKCPNDPEDGLPPFPHDGCPADKHDADSDGIPDSIDKCPLEPEDKDGFEDSDGCPDPDNDGDGIPDAQDKCPLCPEDKDGFEDADGCPDLDNDHDGIPDSKDKCPNEPETVNGFQDEDGCPDAGAVNVRLDGDRMQVGKPVAKATDSIVDQMSLVMMGHTEVTKWLVAIALPSATDAKRVGDAVKARLAARGVTAEIEILAAAGSPKIGALVQARADAGAPFVCPADLVAKPHPK